MAVQYSIQKMVSDGTLSTIALGIQYLQRNDIYMRIAGEETPQSGAPSGYTWYFVDNTTLKILPVVPNGVEVVVYRRTDVDAMYNVYSQNAQFDEATIDENNQQLLYIAQEYLEQGIPGAGVDTIEFLRDDGVNTFYRIKRTDGSYSEEFAVPSVGTSANVLAWESLRRTYANAGLTLVSGSFEVGGTLTSTVDVLLHTGTGKAYAYTGTLPHTVPPNTVPTAPNYIDKSSVVVGHLYKETSVQLGVLTLDSRVAGVWDVPLSGNVTALNIVGATQGVATTIEVTFRQPSNTSYSVVKPSNVILEENSSAFVVEYSGFITRLSLTSVDGGTTWFSSVLGVYKSTPGPVVLPTVTGENAAFNDECDVPASWTASNCNLTMQGGYLRQTKTNSGSNSSMTKTISTFTPTNNDYILYGKMRAKYDSTNIAVIWLLNGTKEASIWLGSADGGSTVTQGAISLRGTVGASTKTVVQVASAYNYEASVVEFAMHFDKKYSTLTLWFKEVDGRWKFKGRVNCDWFSAASMQALIGSTAPANSWVEFDYITLAKPNLVVFSDSIGEGKTLFSPNPALNLTNDESTWMRHAKVYQQLRNNLIVNKGVGGNSSTEMNARINDVTSTGAKLVFMHASTNDQVKGVSLGVRSSTIQSMVDQLSTSGAQVVLLNAVTGTVDANDNKPTPVLRDYVEDWWDNYKSGITNTTFVDIMAPIRDSSGFMRATYADATDKLHPSISGYTTIGQYIAG